MTAEGAAQGSADPVGPVPDGGRHGSDRAGERVAEQLLSRVREDLSGADSKAAVLLSGTLALPAFLLGWHGAPGWHGPADVTLVLAAVLWAGAVIALIGALMPRTGTVRAHDAVTYFGDLTGARGASRDLTGLATQVAEAGREPVEWLLVQAVDVSSILSVKYRAIRWGMSLLALSAALALAWGLTPR
ncbi:Pycsar system effector family protein [Streptomyces odontomachi]|uniref:Pycsar system effector family protein n=1 Tax=Streptomyces odontomachi TaxID=2944940 RepID=UPI00210EEABF|nr:Pycsar system effector family protein [Streptomyces sp. ODS25]